MADESAPPQEHLEHDDSPPGDEPTATAPPAAFMIPMGLIFLAGSIALIVWACGAIFEHIEAGKTFRQTTGRILSSSSETVRKRGRGRRPGIRSPRWATHQDMHLTYEYSVDGNSYVNGLLDFGENIRPTKWSVDVVLNKYPEGANVPVYYDPTNPQRAVLQLDWPAENLLCILMGCSFGLLFLGLMLSSVANPDGGVVWSLGRAAWEPGRLLAALTLLNALLMCGVPWFFGPLTVNASLIGGLALGVVLGVLAAIKGPRKRPAGSAVADPSAPTGDAPE